MCSNTLSGLRPTPFKALLIPLDSRTLSHKKAGTCPAFSQQLRRDLILIVLEALRLRAINQLDIGHGRLVASAIAALQDTDIAARAGLVRGTQLGKQLAHSFFTARAVEGKAAVGHAVVLGQGYQRLSIAAQLLALAKVVLINSCSTRDTVMLRNMALR